jgi:hypothetical protein
VLYPKWKYHYDFEPFLCKDEADEKKHCVGWFDSPANYPEQFKVPDSCPSTPSEKVAKGPKKKEAKK